jgi:polysaccharide deacetylase 2 family uncharacterized protein YibQ
MDMTDDDLNAPLGQFPVRKRPPLGKLTYIGLAFGGLGLLGGIGAFFPPGGLAIPEPHAGIEFAAPGTAPRETAPRETLASLKRATAPRPVAEFSNEASVPLPGPLVPSPLVPSAAGPRPQVIDQTAGLGAKAEAMERRSGVKIIRPGGGATPGALIIDVATALNTRLAAAPDPRLIEQTRHGPVPRIGFDGARPAEIYARPAVFVPGLPRIALLVGGMGLSPRATEAAIAGLPGAVTLGFAPYGADLARQTALAREAGHELVLEIPMEPFDFPRDNPGPHTLVADAGKDGNGGNLTWLMSRFTGYAGVANFLGGKFTADAKALTPVLREFAARGLFYVDDGTSARSLAMTLASGQDLTAARADIVIDSTAEPGAIEAALARLEAIARDKGLSIGVASALPASVESIGRFARALEARGIALVPLSSAMPRLQRGVAEQQP